VKKHIHYWLIGEPDGETSIGVCKFCGEEKVFYNSLSSSERSRTPAVRVSEKITHPNWVDRILERKRNLKR
jgi:hypothetical protein